MATFKANKSLNMDAQNRALVDQKLVVTQAKAKDNNYA